MNNETNKVLIERYINMMMLDVSLTSEVEVTAKHYYNTGLLAALKCVNTYQTLHVILSALSELDIPPKHGVLGLELIAKLSYNEAANDVIIFTENLSNGKVEPQLLKYLQEVSNV